MGAADASVVGGAVPEERWSLPARVAFRFCFLYFGLFCLSNQIITMVISWFSWNVPDPASLPPIRQLVFWVGAHVFHLPLPLVYEGSGSGDKAFDWTVVAILLFVSVIATIVWSWLDRKRPNYEALLKWFRLCLRYLVAGQLLSYGFGKVFPSQMPFPPLFTLMERFGNMSPMGVLWGSIGAAQAYEVFAGAAEATAGILLLFPRTALLGAMVAVADMTQVFLLNMTYDVPVKILSFHLLLMSAFLIAPEGARLARFFILNEAVGPSREKPLFRSARANRIALVAQIALGVWLLAMSIAGGVQMWRPARAKSPLYGIWHVETMSIDGQVRAPLTTDSDRWGRIIFDYPTLATIETVNDDWKHYRLKLDPEKSTIDLSRDANPKRSAHFAYDRKTPDAMVFDGAIDGRPVHVELKREDETKFLLVSRGFHWRQDYPFNR